MPYQSVEDLPEPVKKLPLRARVIWMDAFNRAYYAMVLPEDRCFMYAWGSCKRAGFRKNPKTGKWQHYTQRELTQQGFKVFRMK